MLNSFKRFSDKYSSRLFPACLLHLQLGVWNAYLSLMVRRFKAGEVPLPLTMDNLSWVVATADIGTLLFSFPTGYLMDRFGRIFTLRLAYVCLLLAVVLTIVATGPYPMYLASLLVGAALCVASSTTALYVAEIAKPNIRGSLGSMANVLYVGGMAVTMTFGPYLSFKALTYAILLCPLAGFVLTFFIVESPYYHFIRNDEASASTALSRVRNKKTNEKDVELASIRKNVDDDLKDPSNYLELFSHKSNRKAFVIVLILAIVRPTGGHFCVMIHAPALLPEDSYWDPKISMMIFSWLNVVASILGMSLVDRFGRKPLLMISLLGLSLVTAVSAVFYYFHQKTDIHLTQFLFVPHVGVILFAIFFPIGIGPVGLVCRGELLSVRIKGSASAIVQIVVSTCQFFMNKAYFAVDQSVGVYLMYVIFSAINFVGFLFTIACFFETKGKTLEEIQYLLNR